MRVTMDVRERQDVPDINFGKWIPVDERLPEDDRKVLCRYVFGKLHKMSFYQVLDYYAFDPCPHFQHEGSMGMIVTHWMPLPQPPEEDV